ncbi:hypothetical protein A6F55_23855 [Prescottella equi]|uniref:hypothetical protein n=1 Tax=Rhodococcus hoagii TaxID=43767 RepID=UPI000A103AE7|nr:hypothetical protein [Prescottella equi]ORJ92601.1 hypothetical protein A6F55_23855 [Prescottella equi]
MSLLRFRRKPATRPLLVQPTGAHAAATLPVYAGLARENVLPRWEDIDAMPLGVIVENGVLA